MKKIGFITFLCFALILQLRAQDKTKKDTPDEQITVNRQYDENGNLVQFDSTYVHQWSSDSTFNFPFNKNFTFDGNLQEFMDKFMGDSAMTNFDFPDDYNFSPFDDNFMNPMMTDSMFVQRFHLHPDSLFNFHHSFPNHLQSGFDFPDMQSLQKQMEDELNRHGTQFPEFKSQEQKDEWEKLMKKHQQEKEDLLQKWENNSIKKP